MWPLNSTYHCFRGVFVVTGYKGVNVLHDLSVSVLQVQTMSHIAGYKSVSVFSGCQNVSMLQSLTVSVCCKLSQCQCVARINICKCVAGCHNVSVLQALTVSACCTH